ncbi:MAG: hypothetical protein KA004_14310 [Verrucomicrobiales bacterium]|nr:hypothetical protein [Verrucomicrobiales bacterium]
MNNRHLLLGLAAAIPVSATAQVFDPNAAQGGGNNTTIVNKQQPQGNNQFLGTDVPFMNPGDEVAMWNGHAWDIKNNRLFRGRFEKYLAAPEDNAPEDQQYRKVMFEIIQALTPKQGQQPSLHRAVGLLQVAAQFPIDARLCDTIASAIWTVWMVQKNEKAMEDVNKLLQKEIDNLAMRVEVGADGNTLSQGPRPGGSVGTGSGNANQGGAQQNNNPNRTARNNPPTNAAGRPGATSQDVTQFTRLGIDMQKILEKQSQRALNVAKFGINEIKAKVEFQGLIIQMFLQRRFEHVLIACRSYNYMFSGQDRELQIKQGSDVEKMFAKGIGVNPTISTLEAFASEAIRDVDEGVKSFEYSIEKNELKTASDRLGEAFAIGEYLPRVRTLPRTKKERVLDFVRQSNMLISSLEVKDYGRADEILRQIREKSTDFDDSKPRAAVEAARAGSNLHIEAAKLAAVNKDPKKVEEEIRAAAELWPTNPAINEFTKTVATEGNVQMNILRDFDSLMAQRNFRQIAKDAPKYAAVMLSDPDKMKQLQEAVDIVKRSETAVIKADELARNDNPFGAWESVQEALKDQPEDTDLNKRNGQFASQVSEFVSTLNKAKKLEEANHFGASLSWYLKALRIYPASRFAKEGIDRMSTAILPDDPAAGSLTNLPAPTNAASPSAEPSFLTPPTNATPPTSAPPPPAPENAP